MTIRNMRTPPLRPDADPARSAEYASRLTNAKTIKETNQVHKEFADLRAGRNFRQEISGLIHAPKGSPEAKARDKLGIGLILFGIFGISLLVLVILLIAGAIVWIF